MSKKTKQPKGSPTSQPSAYEGIRTEDQLLALLEKLERKLIAAESLPPAAAEVVEVSVWDSLKNLGSKVLEYAPYLLEGLAMML